MNKCGIILSLLLTLIHFSVKGQDFEVAPVKLLYDCEPGQIQERIITIRNHANQKQQFTLTLADIPIDSAGKKIKSEAKQAEKSCKNWVTVNPAVFELNPNETREAKVVLQVPPGHGETRWAMLYVTAVEEQTAHSADKQLKSGVKVKPRIGVKIIQSPKSNTNYAGAIGDLKEITQPKDSLRRFEATVTNTGDKPIDGKVYLVFSNLETAQEVKAKPLRVTVLPGNSKKINLILPASVPAGKYSMAAILDYGNNSALEAVQMNIEVK